jgi:hypothetical protein
MPGRPSSLPRRAAARCGGGVLMDATIAPLPRAVMAAVVCRSRDGRLGITRNPKAAEAGWRGRALGVTLTDRATVLGARQGGRRPDRGWHGMGAAHGRALGIESCVPVAGGSKLKGGASGSWVEATMRLRRAMMKVAAGTVTAGVIERVFD